MGVFSCLLGVTMVGTSIVSLIPSIVKAQNIYTGREIFVENGDSPNPLADGSVNNPYVTLEQALQNAVDGDIIKLKEDVTINGVGVGYYLLKRKQNKENKNKVDK